MSKLDKLLERIDPKNTIDHYYKILDETLNTYEYPSKPLKNNQEVRDTIVDFFWYAQNKLWGENTISKTTKEEKWDFYSSFGDGNMLENFFADNIGLRMARTEMKGGMYRLLQKVGKAIADRQIISRVTTKVVEFFSKECNDDLDLIHAVCEEYARRYAHLLPVYWTEERAGYIKLNYLEVFGYHPFIMKRLGEAGDSRGRNVSETLGKILNDLSELNLRSEIRRRYERHKRWF